MPKVKNLSDTILIIPRATDGEDLKFNPLQEIDVAKITDSIERAESLGYVKISQKATPAKKADSKK